MKKSISFFLLVTLGVFAASPVLALNLKEKLSGRILLQVQDKGKAWYVNPQTQERMYLGRPADAFQVMRELGVGITNTDLEKISLSGAGRVTNESFARKLSGKILLQVQSKGEAWYVNPLDLKRYSLGRPADAFAVMRGLGLGVSNDNLSQISVSQKYVDPQQPLPVQPINTVEKGNKEVVEKKSDQKPSVASGTESKKEFDRVSGSYRCRSYNVSGGGSGDCRLFAPIVLEKNGTYSVSSEKGTYVVTGSTIVLSESKLRGPGTFISDTEIRFEYDYNGWHHTITYLREQGSQSPSTQATASEIPVLLTLEYPAKDSALSGIITVELVPKGEAVDTAKYKPTALAVYDGDRRIVGSFYKATNMPRTGISYTVYTSTGFGATAVGTLDLTAATKETKATIKVTSDISTEAKKTEVVQSKGVEIVVDLALVYSEKDSSLGGINFVTLVPKGEDPVTATYKPTATALWDGDKTINVSFFKSTNQVRTQAMYTVYTDNGYGLTSVGTLDLTAVSAGPVQKTLQASLATGLEQNSSSETTQQTTGSLSATQTQDASSTLPVCNPGIPTYSQPTCRVQ